ncbi:MAG: hypothetical protein DRN95_04475 [Candidatus Hydrothermarchaeota archaeon]|nr:MAG: hypothetical protein DRN95_04475 [Candidatus Hydrothermarchaeota archaeon]
MRLVCISLHHISLPYKEFQRYRFRNPSDFYEKTKEIRERVLIQSGTRIEIYALVEKQEFCFLTKFFPEERKIYTNEKAVRHLFRLVGAIESRVLGENHLHIIVEEAFKVAKDNLAIGKCLEALSTSAKRVSKRIREETDIANVENVVEIAINSILKEVPSIENKKVLLLGGGLSGIKLARALREKGAIIKVANRNYDIGKRIGEEIGEVEVIKYAGLLDNISNSDILICATLASHYRVKPEMIKIKDKLIIVDVSPFRNVDPRVKEIEKVMLLNSEIDKVIRENMEAMRKEIPKVEKIIEEEIKRLREGEECPL